MSDWHAVDKKISEGVKWTGEINVVIDDEQRSLSVRQLNDGELKEILDLIDLDELQEIADELDTDEYERYTDLRDKDELTDQESAELESLEEEIASTNLFDRLSDDTFDGIVQCGMYGIVPDQEDLNMFMKDDAFVASVEDEYNIQVRTTEDLYDRERDCDPSRWAGPAKDRMQTRLRMSTDFTSFTIGLQVFTETLGEVGNSKNTRHQTTGVSS